MEPEGLLKNSSFEQKHKGCYIFADVQVMMTSIWF